MQKENVPYFNVYRKAQQIGRMGNWELNIGTGKIIWSDEIYNLFGMPVHSIEPDFDTFLSFVHPDDQENMQIELKAVREEKKVFDHNYRIVVNDTVRYMHGMGELIKDDNGKSVILAGTVQDITEKYLAEESNRFKAELLNTIGQAVIATDLNGIITYWNKAAENMYGWTADESIGKNVIDIVPPPQSKAQAVEIMNKLMQGEPWGGDFLVKHKFGNVFTAFVTNSPIMNPNQKLTGVIGTSTDISERKKNEENLIAANEELRRLSRYLQNVREDERKRIAREIHDELGQQLTAIKMDISWLNKKLTLNNVEHKQKVADMIGLIDNTIKTVRKIASDLRPAVLDDLGLAEAINWQINEFTKHTAIPVQFNTNVDEEKFSSDATTGVFRIFQESLTNIARHADASKVTCELQKVDSHLLLIIKDDGIGFDADKKDKGKSLGLIGLKERVYMLNGQFKINSIVNKGTEITVSIPL